MSFEQEWLELTAEIAANPLDFEPLIERGNLQAEAGRYEAAITDYSTALELEPSCALAWDNRGIARLYLLDYYPALADFSQAITHDPSYWYAWANRAYVYATIERPQWALDDAQRALSLMPEYAAAYDVIGQALAQLNQLEESLAALTTAQELEPDCVQVPFHRAGVLYRLGRYEEARTDLLRYLTLTDDQQNATARQQQAQDLLNILNTSTS